jgi:hypothetical protein
MPSRVPIPRVRLWDSSARHQTLRFRKGDFTIPKTISRGFTPSLSHLLKSRGGPNQEWRRHPAPPLLTPIPCPRYFFHAWWQIPVS